MRQKVYLDGSPVSLPVVRGSSASAAVTPTGSRLCSWARRARRTSPPRSASTGPSPANIDVTARYRTLHQLLRRAEATGRIGKKEAARLDRRWDDIQALIDPRRNAKLRTALHRFADEVREQTGASIRVAAAEDLLTYAQAVYRRIGGSGKV